MTVAKRYAIGKKSLLFSVAYRYYVPTAGVAPAAGDLAMGETMESAEMEAAEHGRHWSSAELRDWRKRMGWSQERAAAELRMHPVNLKKLERAKHGVRDSVTRLAELLERYPQEHGRF